MTSQCGPRRPNLNETKMRRRYDVACRVGSFKTIYSQTTKNFVNLSICQCNLSKKHFQLNLKVPYSNPADVCTNRVRTSM